MPRIVALRPQSVAGVDLGHVTYQLGFGASKLGEAACFSLLFFSPPATSFTFRPADSHPFMVPWSMTPLVQVPISLAESEAEIERTCAAAREGSTEDFSIKRMAEAFELFRNRSQRIATETVQRCVEDAAEVIRTYWKLRLWMQEGMTAKRELVVKTSFAQREGQSLETTLVCLP